MANDYSTASALLSLIERVDSGQALRLAEIRAEFSVKDDCARSYIAWVQKHRQLVETREGRNKVWRRNPHEDTRPNVIYEAAALSFAVDALAELSGSPHYDALVDMAEQRRLSLPATDQTRLDRVTRNFQVRWSDQPRNRAREAILRDLLHAIHERHPCQLRYQPYGRPEKPYSVQPWGLVLHNGRLLLSGGKEPKAGLRLERRFFTVDGILELTVHSDETFDAPSPRHTDWGAIFKDSFGIFCDWKGGPQDVKLMVCLLYTSPSPRDS